MSTLPDDFSGVACDGGAVQFRDASGALTGDIIALPSLKGVEETLASDKKELTGGRGQVLETWQTDAKGSLKMTFAKVTGAALAGMYGYVVVEDTTGGAGQGVRTVKRLPGSRGARFMLRAITAGSTGQGSNVGVKYFACEVTSQMPFNITEADFSSFEIEASFYEAPDGWTDIDYFESRTTMADLVALDTLDAAIA